MNKPSIVIDTNLLLLFVVGLTSMDYIEKHKRLQVYTRRDFEELSIILSRYQSILLTPNTLTETSNLASYIQEPAKSEIMLVLKYLIEKFDEEYVHSKEVVKRQEFVRLGLADATLLELSSRGATVVTTDLSLYLAIMDSGKEAVNFNHIRNSYL